MFYNTENMMFKVGDLVEHTVSKKKGIVVRILKNHEYDHDYRAEIDLMSVMWASDNKRENFSLWWTWFPLYKEWRIRNDFMPKLRVLS